jgi:hypothetical protein
LFALLERLYVGNPDQLAYCDLSGTHKYRDLVFDEEPSYS